MFIEDRFDEAHASCPVTDNDLKIVVLPELHYYINGFRD